MKHFNSKPILSLSPWTIFCVFSITESHKSKFFSLTTSLFFTNQFKLVLDDEVSRPLYYNNYKYIFDINDNYPIQIIEKIDVGDNNTLILFKGDLKSLLANQELFKDVVQRNEIRKSLFIFHNIKWKDICKNFLENNIVISGGSSTRRHIISPVQVKLMVVLNIFNFSYQDIVSSFNNISILKEISLPKDSLLQGGREQELSFKPSTVRPRRF